MNSVYATIKDINNDLINKANREDYQLASFEDAMNLAITSNALSLIKGFMQNNCCSITNAFNMRNILEHYVFILMNNAGDISDMHKDLFNVQYKLIEYNCYNNNNYSESKNLIDKNIIYKTFAFLTYNLIAKPITWFSFKFIRKIKYKNTKIQNVLFNRFCVIHELLQRKKQKTYN